MKNDKQMLFEMMEKINPDFNTKKFKVGDRVETIQQPIFSFTITKVYYDKKYDETYYRGFAEDNGQMVEVSAKNLKLAREQAPQKINKTPHINSPSPNDYPDQPYEG